MTEGNLLTGFEVSNLPETGVNANNKFGLVLIGHDAIELGVTEEIVASMLDRLKDKSNSIELGGVVILDSINEKQIKQIYPDLKKEWLDAFTIALGQKSSVLVSFQQTVSNIIDFNFIDEINKIKGKIQGHKTKESVHGWGESIRSAIPLPSDRKRYEEADNILDKGNLSPDDYTILTNHLVHSPDNEGELAGLYMLFDDKTKKEIFGNSDVKVYDKWAQELTSKQV